MAKIKSFAPGFLHRPAPGHKLFELPPNESKLPAALAYSKRGKPGPKRTIALRGSEVFVAVGKQIRWGNLTHLKDSWESKQSRGSRHLKQGPEGSFEVYDEEAASGHGHSATGSGDGYRIIKTPVSEDIRQLVMSPEHDFLAVLTSHTVHICILPDSSHLLADDETPFKPKFWTLGPTTHVTTRAPIAAAIWHPLGVNGSCLVTITEDAVVRLWELSVADRWSFDSPTLAIDLKRLADGTSLEQDFSASTSATNKGFSPDLFDMEVAAACFPGRGSGGWSAMTLWIAMVGGDVYALCPLLPSRWSPPPTLLPSLSVSIVECVAAMEDDAEVSPEAKILAQQQLEWISDLDNQEPKLVDVAYADHPAEVYQRPSRPGIVPKLQGPFQLEASPDDEQDDEIELRDIYVIGAKISTAALMDEDEEFDVAEDDKDGLSLSIICLLSASGQVKTCLDTEGVQAKWLPPRNRSKRVSASPATSTLDSLLTFQTFDTLKPAELTSDSWPMFSDDVTSRYSFYITHPAGITSVSLATWISRLEGEVESGTEAGAGFRIDLLLKGQGAEVERVYTQPAGQNALAAAVSLMDPDLGHLVLSATLHDPVALFFDMPEREMSPLRQETPLMLETGEPNEPPVLCEPRPLFHPSEVLDRRSAVPDWHEHIKTGRRSTMLQQQVKLSVATLEVFTDGHRLVSAEVFELNNAVAELFRKCEALRSELQDQITKANDVKGRIDTISGNDSGDDDEPVSDDMLVTDRLRMAKERQRDLAQRMESIRKRLGRATSRELSDKEKAWGEEVRALGDSVLGSGGGKPASPSKAKPVWQRFDELQALRDELLSEASQLEKKGGDGAGHDGTGSPARGIKIPMDLRKAKVAQVVSLLERETALVDAVKSRLERLSIG